MNYPLSARILWAVTFLCWAVGYASFCTRFSVVGSFGSLLLGGLCMILAELIAATEE